MSFNFHEHRKFSEVGHDIPCSIAIEMNARADDGKSYHMPIYGTSSRKDKLSPKCYSTFITHVLIPSDTDIMTLTKMSIALVIEDN